MARSSGSGNGGQPTAWQQLARDMADLKAALTAQTDAARAAGAGQYQTQWGREAANYFAQASRAARAAAQAPAGPVAQAAAQAAARLSRQGATSAALGPTAGLSPQAQQLAARAQAAQGLAGLRPPTPAPPQSPTLQALQQLQGRAAKAQALANASASPAGQAALRDMEAARIQLRAAQGQEKAGKRIEEGTRPLTGVVIPGVLKGVALAATALHFADRVMGERQRMAFEASPALKATAGGSTKQLDIATARTLKLTEHEQDTAYGKQVIADWLKKNPDSFKAKSYAFTRAIPGWEWAAERTGVYARQGQRAREGRRSGKGYLDAEGKQYMPPRETINLAGAGAGLPQSQYMNYGQYTEAAQMTALNTSEQDTKILQETLEVLREMLKRQQGGEPRGQPRW